MRRMLQRAALVVVSVSAGLGCAGDTDQSVTSTVAPVTTGEPTPNGVAAAPAGGPSAPGNGGMPAPAAAEPTPPSEGATTPAMLAPPVPPVGAKDAPDAPAQQPAPTPPATSPTPDTAPPVGPEPDPLNLSRCTGTNPIACHFGGAPGNYLVTVLLGGEAAATTRVLAEARRSLLGPVATASGETRRLSFGVNVRQPEGEPIQDVPAGTPGLDVYFEGSAGSAPALSGIGYAPASEPLMIYIAGDSTVADQTSVDYGGWGQQLPQFFASPVVVANYADSGESSGSFLNARPLFGTIEAALRASDWVLIQFGHNDKTVTAAQFHDNMTSLVTRVKAKGALPVLLSPVARAQFDGDAVARQHVNSTGADLPAIVAQVASEQAVPLLDLTARTSEWLAQLGPGGWQAFHALGTDVTHTNDAGAAVEAGFVRDLLIQADLKPLLQHLR